MLIELVNGKYKTISIVGMSKNSGKTVTLNHLISEAIYEDIPIGITSIGRDGEGEDIVTETEKPRIFVEEGTLVATAREMLSLGDANIEIMQVTDFRSPMGEIIIGRVRTGGYIQVAGPQLLSEIKKVSDIMLELGANFVIIDGALDRISSANPEISEATLLATGAVLSRDMNRAIEETAHVVNLFNLPAIEDIEEKEQIKKLIDNNKIAIIDENGEEDILPIKTALSAGSLISEHIKESSKYLIIPGSLVRTTLNDLTRSTRKYKNIEIVVTDGTKIFVNPKDWIKFERMGIKVRVLEPIDLVALTLNPFAPQGYYFDPDEFLKQMKTYIKHIPVMDLVLGGE